MLPQAPRLNRGVWQAVEGRSNSIEAQLEARNNDSFINDYLR